MACDLAVAAEGTKLGEPRSATDRRPVTLLMPYLIGQKRTRELLLTGDLIDAAEAERIGLINRVVPADRLAAEVDALADRLARTPPEVMGPTKLMLNRAMDAAGFRLAVEAGSGPRAPSSTRPTRPSSASGTRSSGATGSRRRSPGATVATTSGWRRAGEARRLTHGSGAAPRPASARDLWYRSRWPFGPVASMHQRGLQSRDASSPVRDSIPEAWSVGVFTPVGSGGSAAMSGRRIAKRGSPRAGASSPHPDAARNVASAAARSLPPSLA